MKLWISDGAAKLWATVLVGAGIGLLGAYGREQHEGRSPGWKWFAIRLAAMPLLALTAAAAVDQFGLKGNVLGFVSALLSILGYDAVRVITARALKRAEAGVDQLMPADAVVHVPAGSHMPAIVELEPPPGGQSPTAAGIGEAMRRVTASTLKSPLPPDQEEPLRQLGKDDPR